MQVENYYTGSSTAPMVNVRWNDTGWRLCDSRGCGFGVLRMPCRRLQCCWFARESV